MLVSTHSLLAGTSISYDLLLAALACGTNNAEHTIVAANKIDVVKFITVLGRRVGMIDPNGECISLDTWLSQRAGSTCIRGLYSLRLIGLGSGGPKVCRRCR